MPVCENKHLYVGLLLKLLHCHVESRPQIAKNSSYVFINYSVNKAVVYMRLRPPCPIPTPPLLRPIIDSSSACNQASAFAVCHLWISLICNY